MKGFRQSFLLSALLVASGYMLCADTLRQGTLHDYLKDSVAMEESVPVPILWQKEIFKVSLPSNQPTQEVYAKAVERVFSREEKQLSLDFHPGKKRRVGIKIYTASGEGLETPKELTRAVIQVLQSRGYALDEIFILDQQSFLLTECGYLPPLSQQQKGSNTFAGVRVITLQDKGSTDRHWYYDRALSDFLLTSDFFVGRSNPYQPTKNENSGDFSRKSFLPVALLFDVDFWINLPVLKADRTVGVSGAMANSTLWNMTNAGRFLNNPQHAALAVAEVMAIPEYRAIPTLHLLSLSAFQFLETGDFRAQFCRSLPQLLASNNPLALDHYGWRLLNQYRLANELAALSKPKYFEFAEFLDLASEEDYSVEEIAF